MGTSTAGSELPSDKLAKLQARRKELEVLLAAKNEDLYKLCVQEVKLTGIMPPEVPNSGPETPREVVLSPAVDKFHASSSSDRRDLEGTYRKDISDSGQNRKSRQANRHSADKIKDSDSQSRKQVSHRLSTPSISGVSSKSYPRKGEYASANYVSLAHDNHDSFSLHSSQTYPALAPERTASVREQRRPHASADTLPASYTRHHTVTTQQLSRLYYNSERPETQTFTKMHETHFSSSHPDISTHYIQTSSSVQPGPVQATSGTPLLYQYASQLKARSHHLSAMQVAPPMPARNKPERRNTLQRTLTYHLTSPSDYPGHFDNATSAAQHSQHVHRHLPPTGLQIQPDLDPQLLPTRRHHSEHQSPVHSVQSFQYSPVPLSPQSISASRQLGLNHSSNSSLYGSQYVDTLDQKGKEKEWYESSLDSPSDGNMGMNLSRESIQLVQTAQAVQPIQSIQPVQQVQTLQPIQPVQQVQSVQAVYHSPKKSLQRTPSIPQPHVPQAEGNEYPLPVTSQIPSQSPMTSPSQPTPAGVQFESPKNCTVVESGKWIPYREVTKPFEMSDFYKYSTKFRQSNNPSQKPRLAPPLSNTTNYHSPPEEAHGFNNPEQWRQAHQL